MLQLFQGKDVELLQFFFSPEVTIPSAKKIQNDSPTSAHISTRMTFFNPGKNGVGSRQTFMRSEPLQGPRNENVSPINDNVSADYDFRQQI